MWDVVIVTEDRFEAALSDTPLAQTAIEDERLLTAALTERGARVTRVSWSSPTFDWTTARSALIRSTWDYVERFEAFCRWVAAVETRTRLVNSPALLRWNWDKRYLADLQQRNVRIPATRFLTPSAADGAGRDLRSWIADSGWESGVLKPAVSAGAVDTLRLAPQTEQSDWDRAAGLILSRPMLLQEYLPAIEEKGELSIVLFGGEVSHAVRKRTKTGDFRVQVQHGGRSEPVQPAADEIGFARQVLAACPAPPLYARVDIVRDRSGHHCLMELELIEPDLFCRLAPGAADRLARALLAS